MNYKSDVLIIMPCPIKGGAEKQFSFLIRALEERKIKHFVMYSEIYTSRIKNLLRLMWNIIIANFEFKPRMAIVYDVYGKYAIPLIKLLGVKIIYSERNNGNHRLGIGKWCIELADILVANSKTAIVNMKEYVNKPIVYIPNGVVVPEVLNNRNLNKTISKILVPARIHPTKYQHLLVEVAKVRSDLDFYLYGKVDDEKYYLSLIEMIENAKADNIHYMGFEDGLEKQLQNYDLVLLASENEGNSNAVLEALAYKVLCVASKMDSNEEIVRDHRFLFDNTSSGIVKVIEDVDKMSTSEKNAVLEKNWKFVKDNFSVEKMCGKYLRIMDCQR